MGIEGVFLAVRPCVAVEAIYVRQGRNAKEVLGVLGRIGACMQGLRGVTDMFLSRRLK